MKIHRLIFIAFLFLLSACSVPQYVTVPVNYNPKITFNPDSTTILLINRYDFAPEKITNDKKLAVLKAGAFTAIHYAETQLALLPKVKVINLVDSVAFTITTDSVKQLAAKYKANYVLALKKFSAGINLDGVANSMAYYNTGVDVNFILYEADGIFYKTLNGTAAVAQPEVMYPGLIGSLIIHPTIRGSKSSINSAAQSAAFNALLDYLPYTISHDRPLFNDDFLQPAVREIMAGNFDKAENLLLPFLKNADPKIISKAAYNLAVVYEAEGDIDAAYNVAQLSLDKNQNLYASNILTDLKME